MQHRKKNLYMFILPLLSSMCCEITVQIKYEMIGTVIVLIIAVLIITANNKHSAWYFYLPYNVNKYVL